jgi:hypothetical protein
MANPFVEAPRRNGFGGRKKSAKTSPAGSRPAAKSIGPRVLLLEPEECTSPVQTSQESSSKIQPRMNTDKHGF